MKPIPVVALVSVLFVAFYGSCGGGQSLTRWTADERALDQRGPRDGTGVAPHNTGAPLDALLALDYPVVVAHGKGENVATESTWKHMEHSIANGAQIIELDVQVMLNKETGRIDDQSEHLVFHDPTFHRVSEGYATTLEKEQKFWREKPRLAKAHQDTWQFHLFDRISRMRPDEVRGKIFIRNTFDDADYDFLFLSEVLGAFRDATRLKVPDHFRYVSGSRASVKGGETVSKGPLALYLDDKDLVALARRLGKLSNWDWDRDSLSTSQLYSLTATVLRSLAEALRAQDAVRRVFIAARHEEIASMVNRIVPELAVMISSENLNRESTFDDFKREFSRFDHVQASLIELKFLNQVLDPRVHEFARRRGLQVFFNQIKETDASQFEGKYEGNLGLLFKDIFSVSQDVFIQTNTVQQAFEHIQGRVSN